MLYALCPSQEFQSCWDASCLPELNQYLAEDLFIYLFIYTIFQEGDIFSSTASLPYGPLRIKCMGESFQD